MIFKGVLVSAFVALAALILIYAFDALDVSLEMANNETAAAFNVTPTRGVTSSLAPELGMVTTLVIAIAILAPLLAYALYLRNR